MKPRAAVNPPAESAAKDGAPPAAVADAPKPKRKQAHREVPQGRTPLDDALTVVFICLILLVFYHVRSDAYWLPFLVVCLVGVFFLINASKFVAQQFGKFLSESVLNTNWTPVKQRRPLKKAKSMKKFTDQSWQFVIHFSMSVAEYWLVFVERDGCPEGQTIFDNTTLCWTNPSPEMEHSNMEKFYVLQLSIWIVTCFSHRFIEARHKDYYEMYIHHIATIGLVAASWMLRYMKIGVLVLIIHDVSDVPLDLMKMANYLKLQGPRSFFFVEVAFVFNLLTWAFFRLFIYPTKAIYSAFVESPVMNGHSAEALVNMPITEFAKAGWNLPGWTLCNILLSLLQLLHILWFLLLVRILIKLIRGTEAHDAGEDEYEGQSTDNEEG